MSYSAHLSRSIGELNNSVKQFGASWNSLEGDWKDQQRKKFESQAIQPIVASSFQLYTSLQSLTTVVRDLEKFLK